MQKTIEELLAEKQTIEKQIAQYQHRADRLENRESSWRRERERSAPIVSSPAALLLKASVN